MSLQHEPSSERLHIFDPGFGYRTGVRRAGRKIKALLTGVCPKPPRLATPRGVGAISPGSFFQVSVFRVAVSPGAILGALFVLGAHLVLGALFVGAPREGVRRSRSSTRPVG